MSINVSVHGGPASTGRGKMLITDIENLKKTEISRRRRLRLEQVRQQSKDIAHHIRQKVQHEQHKQGSAFEQQQTADLQRLQARRLLLLQQHYQDCLDEVGMGHMQAALQPEPAAVLEAERLRNWAQAEDRGREATAKLRLKLADVEQRKNAPRKQQNFVRAVEDLRAVVVTSLGNKSLKRTPKKRQHHHEQQQQQLEQPLGGDARIPRCTCGCAVCICTPQQTVTADVHKVPSPSKSESQQVNKQEDNIAVSLDTSDTLSERSSSAEPRLQTRPTSSTATSSLTAVQKTRVQFYDHGNRFVGDHLQQIRVERMFPRAHELDATQAAEVESRNSATSKFLLDDTSNMLHGRGRQALVRERLYQDYRQLLDDLHALAREERLVRSTWPHSLPTEIFQEDYRRKELCRERQKNMDSLFESVYHSVHQHLVSHPSSGPESHVSHHWEMTAQDSPARLNVANCEMLSIPQQKATSPVNTINVAPTSTDTQVTSGSVCSERKVLTLEDLVERINFQHSLLMDEMNTHGSVPQEPLGNSSSAPKKDNMDTVDSTHQFSADRSSSEVKSSLQVVHDVVSHEEGPSVHEGHDDISHEEGPSVHEGHDGISHEEGPSLHEGRDDISHEEGLSLHEGRDISHEEGPPLPEGHDDVSHEEEPPLHEGHDDASHEEGPSLREGHDISHEKECTYHEQKVTQSAEGLKDDSALFGGRRNDDHNIHEEEIIHLPVEFEKHGDCRGNRECDALIVKAGGKRGRKHRKGKVEGKIIKERNIISEIDPADRGEIEIRRNDSVTVLSEYSFDISVSRAREHNVELSSETSSSTSYEGLKVVVSVSELTQKKYQSTSPHKGAGVSCRNFPWEVEKHHVVGRKTGKWKHKQHDTGNRNVKEKATMRAEDEIEGSGKGKLKTDVMIERRESNTREEKNMKLDRTVNSQDMISTNGVRGKALSEGSTSYMSLPDQLDASNIQHLEKLLAAWHDYKNNGGYEICKTNPWLAGYILRLLAMSRKSVKDLHMSTSDISTPDVETSVTEGTDIKTFHETIKPHKKEKAEMKETTANKTHTDVRSEVHTVKQLINTVKDKTKVVTDEVPMDHKAVSDSRQGCHVTSVPQVAGPHSYNEFRRSDTKIQSTSTPEKIQNSCGVADTELHEEMGGLEDVIKRHAVVQELHSSCTNDDNSCEFDVKTPPFTSVISDMSLDEYKAFKFPQIFSDYSEKCSERISHLTKKIEQIRGEKKKLIESSGSCSSSASSSNASTSINGFDSTKYLSPPELSVVRTHIPSKDEGPAMVNVSDQEAGNVRCVCDAGNQHQIFQNKELSRSMSVIQLGDGNETSVQRQHSRRNHPHVRPPPCLWTHKLQRHTRHTVLQAFGFLTAPNVNVQSAVNPEPNKELSTITEGVSVQSPHPSSCNTQQAKSVTGEKSKNSESSEILGDEDIPDVMTDMLRRGLITSPLAWTKVVQQSDDETSVSEVLIPGLSHDTEGRNFIASSPQHVEQEKFKQAVLESYVGEGTGSPESFRDRQSIADRKMGFSQQVAETFAKLGKNPSRTDVTNAFKNLGLKWKARGRDQYVNPVISKEGLDPASEEFRQQVLESFVGLGLDSSPEDLQAAFQRLGLDCPGAYLCRSDVNESKQTHRASVTPESAGTVRSSNQFYGASSCMSGTDLPPEPPSDPASCDDDLST